MASLTAKTLGLGELTGTGIDTLYDNPASTTTRIKTIVFYNGDTAYHPVTVYGSVSGTDYPIAYQMLHPSSTWVFETQHPIVLSADAHLLNAQTDGTGVTYFLCGFQSATPTTLLVPKHITQANGGVGITYTVPTGYTFYLYHALLFSDSSATYATGSAVEISITDPAGPTTKVITSWCGRANDYWAFDTPIILEENWVFTVYVDNGASVWLDGAEEDVVP
jgi:hypothetical protein